MSQPNKHFSATCLAGIITMALLSYVAEAQNPCSAGKMWANFNEMKRANCKKCDKYFHCQGNYEAVHKCSGPLKVTTAATISNAREWLQGGGSGSGRADSAADQVANRYGRNGGNCAAKYLKSYGCAYNPRTRACKW